MKPVLRGLVFRVVVVFALVVAISSPYVIIQSIAWSTMLVKLTRSEGFSNGLRMTFDGNHPCKLCLLAEKIKEDEKTPERKAAAAKVKLDLALPAGMALLVHPPVPAALCCAESQRSDFSQSPPHPPPRLASI